jgi:hypothetical protein
LLATSEEVLALRRLPYRDAVELVKTILKNPDVNERPKININSIRSHVDTIPSFEKDIIDLQL